MANGMARVSKLFPMGESTKEIGKMASVMERVRIHMLVVLYMKEITKMERGMERVSIYE